MISRVSSFLGPKSIFNIGGGGTPSLVLSLDAAGYTSSGLWGDLSIFNNDGVSDGLVSWSSEGGGSFDFDGSSAYFIFGKSNYNFDPSPLVSYGVTFSSDSVTSTEPDGNWDTKQTVSSESYSGGVRLKFKTGGPNPGFLMCGLSDNPYGAIVNYSKPKYGFYVQGPSLLTIVEDGNFNINPMAGTYSDATNYNIIWDGTEVKYYVDEVLVYTSTSTPTNPLYLYCTFLNSELIINNIEFGPYAQGIPIGNSPYVQGLPVGNSPYTMEAWFKSDSFGPSEQGTLIGWGTSGQMYKSNVLRLNANGLTNYWWGDDISVNFSGASSMYVDNWYYVAATYDGTTRRLYLNGNLEQSGVPGAPLEVDDIQSLKVGYSYTNYFDGKISKVKVHTKALSSSKILSNFNSDKVRHGYVFGSMTFTQSESSYLFSSSSDYVFGTNDFTIEAFFKSSMSSGTYGSIISLRENSPYTNGIDISLSNTNTATPNIEFCTDGDIGTVYAPTAGPGETLYYIRLLDASQDNVIMFNGFFYVDDSTNIVQTFYDSTNPTVDIRSTSGNGGPTYLYEPGWLCFDGGGCNITSFPYLYGETQGDYNLYGDVNSSTGNNVDGYGNVTYEFSLTPFNPYTASNSYTASNDVWYHVAISRNSGTSSFFVNGELIKQVADTYSYSNSDLVIGRYYTDIDNYYFNGIISNVRVINGDGLYTSNFTIPDVQLGLTKSIKLLITSQQTIPTTDVSGLLQSVTASNIGWTSSLPTFVPNVVIDSLQFYVDAGQVSSYPGTGTTWYDISGNSRNLTMNGLTYNSADGGYIQFGGSNTAESISYTINLSNGFTVESVAKFSGSQYEGLFAFNSQMSSDYINVQAQGGSNIRWEVESGQSFTSTGTLSSNTWYHFTCVYEGDSNNTSAIARIYINGVENNTSNLLSSRIGQNQTSAFILGLWDGYLTGNIALSRMYNRVLTPIEVLQNFNATKNRYGL